MNPIEAAAEALYGALGTVAGLRVYRALGKTLDPPATLVGPPQLTWEARGPEPTSATFVVPVVVAKNGRELSELARWVPLVAAAVDELPDAAVRRADPGTWPAGGADLPAYLIEIEVGL